MTSVQEVPLKIALVRSGEVVEIRRRRLVNPSYGVVEKVASEVARGKYRLQYTDEDGDVVTMSSQEEWEECLASWDASHPLKLRIELRGPRGLGRSGCRSGSSSRSRSTSSRRRCHRSRSRSVSSTRKHHHWGRRSPSRRCMEVPSRHGSPFGRTHSPSRFQAWLAKMETERRMRQVSCSMPLQAEQPTTQAVPLFMCRGFPFGAKGMHGHGKGFHGMNSHCGTRMHKHSHKESTEKTNDIPSIDEQPQAEHPLLMFRDLIRAFASKGHGKGSKGAHGHGGKGCKGMSEDAGHRRMHKHDCTPADTMQKTNDMLGDEAEHPLFLFRGMHGHGKAKGAHSHGGKGCGGMPEHAGHRHMHHGRRAVNSELIGQKCANCEFQTTGVVDLYCCRACMFGKDHHGKRCQQSPFAEEAEQKTAEQTLTCSSGAVEDDVQQVKQTDEEAQEERKTALPEGQPGEVHGDECKEATPTCSEATASNDGDWVHAEASDEQFAEDEEPNTTGPVLTEQDEEVPEVVEEEPAPNTAEEPQTIASTNEEEPPVVQAPFAQQIAQLQEMGFAVTPQMVDNLAAANGDLTAVVAGFFAQ